MNGNGPAYTDESLQYGMALQNMLNPPDEEEAAPPIKPTAVTSAPGQGDGVPYFLQPNQPSAPTPAPAASSVPATVSQSGNPSGATPGSPSGKSWADYVRQSNDASQQNLARASKAAGELESVPSAAAKNAPLQAQRQQLSMPTPYRDPQTGQVVAGAEGYKPNLAQRIARGMAALRKGGIGGALDPTSVGETAYGAPNARYATAEQQRQARVASIDQQMGQNTAAEKAETERLGKIGTEERANATGEKDIATAATQQQNAESNQEIRQANAEKAEAIAEAAQNKLPTTFEGASVAWANEKDPQKKANLKQALDYMKEVEIKKFDYANRAAGGAYSDLRQSMIDQSTAQIQKLNDYQFDPDANDGKGGFYDPSASKPRYYSPQEFVDQKNQISTKLDADLAKKKLPPLRVRFTVQGSTPGVDASGNLTAPGTKSAPAGSTQPNRPPTPAQANQRGEASYIGEPTQDELNGKRSDGQALVHRNAKTGQTAIWRGDAWRDSKTGKPIQ